MWIKNLSEFISSTLTLFILLNIIYLVYGNSFKFPDNNKIESSAFARSERSRPFLFSQRKMENQYNNFDSHSNHIYDEIDKDNYNYKGWNYLDDDQPHELQKTANLQIVDDPFYIPGRPGWPHDEFSLYNFPNIGLYNPVVGSGYLPYRNGSDATKASDYVWQQLPYAYTGPGYPNKDHGGADLYQNFYIPAQKNGQNADSTRDGAAESSQSDKKHGGGYSPYDFDFFKRKRFRLELNPGIIAAPIAGLAAYKLVSWYASKPLLFELGLVDHKHHHGPHGHSGYPIIPPGIGPVGPPIHGVPLYPSPSLTYPIVAPPFRDEKNPEQTTTKKPWWNPFASLTPRYKEDNKFYDYHYRSKGGSLSSMGFN